MKGGMAMSGWYGKILRVNLTDGKLGVEEPDAGVLRDYIGGAGTGYLLSAHGG